MTHERDVAVMIAAFALVLLVLAIVGYFGYSRWE